ncbi:hypothetical protein BD309DRAFT_222474 [Dichomitus squalens]|uniref:Uncharacterized protein n=1 Tax=Dichomitus squalens TaxID=114155 RepID=A0A4Q9P9K2_9APHY|nr:hypothetical protein BD311DRAFT_806407 [Dichomitus squalens]TBU48766.1 hypothetical protein BD309DRAFT_222474 [Dichomitus squalens]TBU57818.1 hypothetical protein BD310DRAFT_513477 [Dichomitus squalens]
MVAIHQSEDFVRALSSIIFACVTTGHSTIKLFDPITGALEDYSLLKTSLASESHLDCPAIRHSPLGKTALPPPQVALDDILNLLSAYLGKENVRCSSHGKQASPSSMLLHLQILPPHNSKSRPSGRQPLAPKDPETHRMPTAVESTKDETDVSIYPGPLTQMKRAMFFGEGREDKWRPFTVLPPTLLALCKNSTPPLQDDSRVSSGDTSSSSIQYTPAKALQSQDNFLDASTCLDSSRSPSRLVGLGFSALVKDDGSSFDGLGTLTDRPYDNLPSPSDEARARARERRDRRVFGAVVLMRDDLGAKITPQLLSDMQSPARSQAPPSLDRPFAPSTKISTPVSVNALERVPPAAPAKRLIGRMPLVVDERTKFRRGIGRETRPQHDVFAFQRERVSPEWQMESFQRLGGVAGSARTMRGGVGSSKKFSPSPLAPPSALGNQLRFWSYWMTPVNDASGSMGRPAWRP